MFIFFMQILVARSHRVPIHKKGGPIEKPPDLDSQETAKTYATAYYWDMYGAPKTNR